MTKEEIVDKINGANVTLVFALISSWLPALKIPILAWITKYYLAKWFRPGVNEGVVFVAFSLFDQKQNEVTTRYLVGMQNLLRALEGGNSNEVEQADIIFDSNFADAIRIKP